MPSTPTFAEVKNEGCTLHYQYQGSGPLLIFVPGGNGHGRQFNALMGILEIKYTVATFDRRQMSASTVEGPNKSFNPVQQARDIISIMRAIGHETTSIFSSSGGGIIAFQLAVSYPDVIDHLIVHEAPTSSLLSAAKSTDIMDFLFFLQDLYRESGPGPANQAFAKKILIGMDDGSVRQTQEPHNIINQFENEMMLMSVYCPDLQKIVDNHTSVAVGYGTKSDGAFYKETTFEQAKRLGCENVEFPGHHMAFETEPEAFATVLLSLMARMELKKACTAIVEAE